MKDNEVLIHLSSWKCRRVALSVLSVDVHAFTSCFNYCITLAYDLYSMLGQSVHFLMFQYSKSLFETITKLSYVSEKLILICIAGVQEA